jgi:hypothetical protein
MKTIKIAAVFLLTMAMSTRMIAQQTTKDIPADAIEKFEKQQLVVPLSNPGKPFQLHVGLITGSIKVISYEGKDVVIDVTGEEKHKKEKTDKSGGMKRISAGNGMDITAEEKDNTVRVHTSAINSPLNLVIKVPQSDAKIKVSTINGGDIVVSNINGEVEAGNTNGNVTITNVSGSAVANSTNGDIKVSFKSIDPKAAMAFTTFNGAVDITFPAAVKANLKMKSDQGEIYSDFDIATDPNNQPKATKSAKDGVYRVNIDKWVLGKINAGGPEMMMKTWNGNIYVRKAKS